MKTDTKLAIAFGSTDTKKEKQPRNRRTIPSFYYRRKRKIFFVR